MARKQQQQQQHHGVGVMDTLREIRPYTLPVLAFIFFALAAAVTFQTVDRFLTEDPRFTIRKSDYGDPHSPDMTVTGVRHTAMLEIRRAFQPDEGHSIYVTPLEERRAALTRLSWVREATVRRVWPNQLHVNVVERQPVYLVNVAPARRGAPARLASVDDEGRLLPALDQELSKRPLMTGVRADMPSSEIASRVRLMNRVITEMGDEGKPVSEIDVSDPENIKVIYPVAGRRRALTLVLGESAWHQRLVKFLSNWPEVEKRMPRAVKLDLRIEGRINAMEFEEDEEPQRGI